NISEAADRGVPSVTAYPDSPQAKAFSEIAQNLAAQSSIMSMSRRDLTKLGDPNAPRFKPTSS
ncbi:MAG: hypothetical protein ACOCX1_06085, partial [Fimbriimonadaceae bacterium]